MPKPFGRYILNEELGRGGMGIVYKAYDTTLKQQVALKIVLQQQNMKRFLQECSVMSNLQHPNIVNFLGFGDTPYPYFTMEYISGVSLADFIREKKLTTTQMLDILIPISEALSYMHDNNILHRDIKPSNIMITQNGVAKLMDFGLAKTHNDESLSKTGDIIGTIAYMSPEQLTGNVTPQSDIYSLGATMYEALTYKKVFDGETHASVLFQVWHDDPVLPRQINKRISPYVEAVCLKCLQKNPEKRYKNFPQLIGDLKNLKRNRPILAKKYSPTRHFFHIIARYKVLSSIVLISFILLTVLSGCLFYFLQQMRNANANVQQEKRSIAFKLANVALREAREARQDFKWNHAGGLAGAALELVKNYNDDTTKSIREYAKQHIKEALFYSKLLWKYPGVYAGDKRLKQILYSQDDKSLYVVEEDVISLWDVASAKLLQRFSIHGQISDASCTGKNIILTIRAHVDKGVYIFDTNTHQLRKILGNFPSIHTASDKLLVACYDKKMRVIDLAMGNSYHINTPGRMRSLCIDQSGRLLAGVFRNTIYIWDLQKRNILHKILRENLDRRVQFSADGSLVFVENGTVSIFNLTSKNVQHFEHIGKTLFSIASPTAEKFAFINEESIFIFSCKNHRLIVDQKMPSPKYSLYIKGCFTNKQDVFACAEYSVVRYNLANGKKINRISDINSSVEIISWSPDAQKILTLNFDRILRIWNAKNGELLYQTKSDGAFFGKFIDNENFVTYCTNYSTGKRNRYLSFYSIHSNTPHKVNVHDFCVDISPKDKHIASYDDGNIIIKTLAGQLVRKIPFTHKLKYIRFHPYNNSLILIAEKSVYLWRDKALLLFNSDSLVVNLDYDASGHYALLQENNHTLHIVNLLTAQRIKTLIPSSKEIRLALLTNDVKKILCLSHNNESFMINGVTEEITEVENRTTAIAVSPQKNLIAKGFSNGALSVEAAMPCLKPTTPQIPEEKLSKSSVIHTQFSHDGNQIAASYSNNKVQIYNAKSFTPPMQFSFKENQLHIDFNAANTLFMCMGGSAFHIYDLSTGKNTEFRASQPGFFIKATFHPTQQQVLSSSLLRSEKVYQVRLWDLETKAYQVIAQHRKFILDFAISSDGTKLFVLELFGNITIWDIPQKQRIAELELVNSNVSRQKYLCLRGNTLAAIGYKAIFIWNLNSLNNRVQWSIPQIDNACLSFDNKYLLVATKKNIQLREIPSGKLSIEFPTTVTCIASHKSQHSYLLGKANGNTYLVDVDSLAKGFWASSHYRDLFVNVPATIQKSSFDFRSDFPGMYIEKLLRKQPQELSKVLFDIHVDESLQVNPIKSKKLWY